MPSSVVDVEFRWDEEFEIYFAIANLPNDVTSNHIAVAIPMDKTVTTGNSTNDVFAFESANGNVCIFSSSTAMSDISTNLTVLTSEEGTAFEVEVHFT